MVERLAAAPLVVVGAGDAPGGCGPGRPGRL